LFISTQWQIHTSNL